MGDRNEHMFAPSKQKRLSVFLRADAKDQAGKLLNEEKIAAQAQALVAEAYRQMPEDLRRQAETWGVKALMECVWLNGWDCGYRQSVRDRAAIEGEADGN